MSASVRCPHGHWYTPDASGRVTLCPRCKAASHLRSGGRISEEEVLEILGPPRTCDISKLLAEESLFGEDVVGIPMQQQRRVCPQCRYETYFTRSRCPRCGSLLEVELAGAT